MVLPRSNDIKLRWIRWPWSEKLFSAAPAGYVGLQRSPPRSLCTDANAPDLQAIIFYWALVQKLLVKRSVTHLIDERSWAVVEGDASENGVPGMGPMMRGYSKGVRIPYPIRIGYGYAVDTPWIRIQAVLEIVDTCWHGYWCPIRWCWFGYGPTSQTGPSDHPKAAWTSTTSPHPRILVKSWVVIHPDTMLTGRREALTHCSNMI
jgi:hypothetical protein